MTMPEKITIGDVIQIKTNKGFSCAQYTHEHEKYGSLIRIFDKIFVESPSDVETVINENVQFSIFFPLQKAVNQEIVFVIGNVDVSDKLKEFPIFKWGIKNPKTEKVDRWWLWDGEKEWKVGDLSEEQKHFPLRGIVNDTFLIERIESGWREGDEI